MRRPVQLAIAVLAVAVLAACGGGDAEGEAEPTGALERALAQARPLMTTGASGAAVTSASGPFAGAAPHHMELSAEVRIEPSSGVQRLEIRRIIDRGAGGAFRLVDRRTWTTPSVFPDNAPRVAEDRIEVVYDGKAIAMRRGDSAWIERDALGGYPERVLASAYDLDDLVLGSFADYLRWTPLIASETRPDTVAGLPVEWAAAGLDPSVAPRPMAADELAALRDHTSNWTAWVAATHRPMRVDGEVARTKAGELALGKLEVVGIASVEGTEAPFVMRISAVVAPLAAAKAGEAATAADAKAAFELPAERLPEARPRTWKMIEDVLGTDLAPVYQPRP
ncbi:MAG: hypothetical protein U1F43_27580 [Myxococcota bacterium]